MFFFGDGVDGDIGGKGRLDCLIDSKACTASNSWPVSLAEFSSSGVAISSLAAGMFNKSVEDLGSGVIGGENTPGSLSCRPGVWGRIVWSQESELSDWLKNT